MYRGYNPQLPIYFWPFKGWHNSIYNWWGRTLYIVHPRDLTNRNHESTDFEKMYLFHCTIFQYRIILCLFGGAMFFFGFVSGFLNIFKPLLFHETQTFIQRWGVWIPCREGVESKVLNKNKWWFQQISKNFVIQAVTFLGMVSSRDLY